jgi:bifunctional UDP-N-acetylglucosamine pyrophosphorylase/glucosamine-1-phosphate N-acetyltransferase
MASLTLLSMIAVVLVGGESSRMKPISNKNFIKFQSKELLQHRIEALQEAGFERFILVVTDSIKDQVEKLVKKLKIDANIVIQKKKGGMSEAILSIPNELLTEPALVVGANDSVEQELLNELKSIGSKLEHDALVVGKQMLDYFPGGYLTLNDDQTLADIIEKPGPENTPSDLVNIVYHMFRKPDEFQDLIKQIQDGIDSDDVYEQALAEMIKNGGKIKVHPYKGQWQAVKYPWHAYDKFKMYVENSEPTIHPTAQVHPTATIEGHVIIDANAKIDANAVIKGPAFIGANTIIGVGALINESFIEHDCVIGFNTEVSRTVIQEYSTTHGGFLGDSIIGKNVWLAHGVVTANVRLDKQPIQDRNKLGVMIGDNAVIGIGVTFMPGVKVGANATIMPSTIIKSDIDPAATIKSPLKYI